MIVRWVLDGSVSEIGLGARREVVSRKPSNGQPSKWALPTFTDTHCHVIPAGMDLVRPSLRGLERPEDALEVLREAHARMPAGEWLYAVQYDHNRFPGARHLTRRDLDAISEERPILAKHASNHASVANSAALRAAGFRDDQTDPADGSFGRFEDGTINGVLMEKPSFDVIGAVPKPGIETMVSAIRAAADSMAGYGIAGACDMWTGWTNGEKELQAYVLAAQEELPIRIRLYLDWGLVFGKRKLPEDVLARYLEALSGPRIRVAGVKLFADGALGARTAGIYGKYSGPDQTESVPPDRKAREALGTSGQLIYSPEELKRRVAIAHEAGYAVSIHSIGDHCTDLVLDAFEATDDPSRHRIEHCSLLLDDQIERLARLNLHLAMQPEFLGEFGGSYAKNLPPGRMQTMKRFRSVLDARVRTTFSSDRPICVGDPWAAIGSVVKHPIVAGESLSAAEAFAAYASTPLSVLDDALQGPVQLFDSDPTHRYA